MSQALRLVSSKDLTVQLDARTARLDALLTARSFFSFGAGVRSAKSLVRRAADLGFSAVGLADEGEVGGAVELASAAKERGVKGLVGATVPVRFEGEAFPIVLIAASRSGYRNLNEFLTLLKADSSRVPDARILAELSGDLFCLTGGRDGFPTALFARRRLPDVLRHLDLLRGVFRDRLFVQVYHERAPGDTRRRDYLRALARDVGLPLVAAPDVRLVEATDFPLLDALTCARLGIDVTTPHAARPRNDATLLQSPETYGRLLPFPDALANASRIARECDLDLLAERVTPPKCHRAPGTTPHKHLERLCYAALAGKYEPGRLRDAERRLRYELAVVRSLDLAEFFLTAFEVAEFCRSRGILAAGRGSAAASVLCYLLGVTNVDPIEHDLCFERFLHTGKTEMPDVDFDISSARRREVIAWVEERWGHAAEAMVANRITYRLPSAVQDLGRALGMPPAQRDRLSRALGRDFRSLRPASAARASVVFDEVLGDAPVKFVLLDLLARMEPGFVRHLAPHSGGVVLSGEVLAHFSPVSRSSGGLKILSFDKDDVEKLGLIKLDLLGLRMLSALERAREDVVRLTNEWIDFRALPNDPRVWEDIRAGDTMGLFQIESPGQVRLSTQLRPRDLTGLAHQIALFRPGPIQSDTVHPYTRRARGLESVPRQPEPLKSLLQGTHGVILFQEQVLRILVRVCGFDWNEAARMRKALSNSEDEEELAQLRARFVAAAVSHSGWTEQDAAACFAMCAAFRGYGFAESHAWAFAQHSYASAWLRRHHPAPFWAGVLAEHPGMWPLSTLAAEARRFGVKLLRVCVNRSSTRHKAEGTHALRLPFVGVKGISDEVAREIVLERHARGKFGGVDDFHARVRVERDVAEALVLAGAFDDLHESRRAALHRVGVLWNAGPSGRAPLLLPVEDTPTLPMLSDAELLALNYATKGLSEDGMHPLDLLRAELRDLGCESLSTLRLGERVRTAGLIVARQKPPTARGVAFFVLEDRETRVQIVIRPDLWEANRVLLRDAAALIVQGVVYGAGRARALAAERVEALEVSVRTRGYDYG
ncbi:DNA polymerase III subunit alpha [Deinococcus yavapaiensis]|uniref:DNA-directed DNA polymerase n=1 Tax=Deinococcus yavapaiensis KR-236 TaxID=694435 RepID=A0A318SN58_9DEIO|nr:DNA polymerase III subunit alpha [Deinococcus yavapaiensis]PYE56322.1 error-prone DNA polymerase [Deinococcus yavapaiensis KR-236]